MDMTINRNHTNFIIYDINNSFNDKFLKTW